MTKQGRTTIILLTIIAINSCLTTILLFIASWDEIATILLLSTVKIGR